jgi:transposase-like protein
MMDRIEMPCPHCSSAKVKKFGILELKNDVVQRLRCNSCNKTFSDKKLKHASYPAKLILNTISAYNLGYTIGKNKLQDIPSD